MEVRKYVTIVEEILSEAGKKVDPPGRMAAAVAVIKNPFAGQYVEDLTPLMDIGEELGGILGKMAVEAGNGNGTTLVECLTARAKSSDGRAAGLGRFLTADNIRLLRGTFEGLDETVA